MTSPSFERIDYHLRYNKQIERKLVFSVLTKATQFINFKEFCYLGFGSMWFSDFRLAHHILGPSSMISIERKKYEKRANFNRPYKCITVQGDESTEFLRNRIWETPHIAWLDYDGNLNDSVIDDLKILLDNCPLNSVILISINSSRKNYRPRNSSQNSGPLKRIDTAIGQVETLLGAGAIPAKFEPQIKTGAHGDVSEAQFSEFLSESILSFMIHRLKNLKRKFKNQNSNDENLLTFRPLFNFCHVDGAEIITVGGVICSETDDNNNWKNDHLLQIQRNIDDFPIHKRLDLIPLTLKEKLILDSCLPHSEIDFLMEIKSFDVGIDDQELIKYRNFYAHFPVFFESTI